jgi:hypothetical protein
VRADRRHVLGETGGAQDELALVRPEVEPAARALDSRESLDREPGLFDLGTELGGQVEVRRREPALDVLGVAMLAVAKISLDDRGEPRVRKEAVRCPVQERGVPRDADGGDGTPPGRTTRRASASARTRSRRTVRW